MASYRWCSGALETLRHWQEQLYAEACISVEKKMKVTISRLKHACCQFWQIQGCKWFAWQLWEMIVDLGYFHVEFENWASSCARKKYQNLHEALLKFSKAINVKFPKLWRKTKEADLYQEDEPQILYGVVVLLL